MDFDVTSLYGRRSDQRWNRMVMGDVPERMTWSTPDKPAVIAGNGACATPGFARLTYRELDERANQVGHALLAGGLQRGDRVLLYCENSVEAIVTLFGIAKAGLVAAPVNPALPGDVIAWIVGQVEPRLAIVDAGLWARAVAAPAAEASQGAAESPAGGLTPDVTIPIGGDILPGTHAFDAWIGGHPTTEPPVEIPLHADDVWLLTFTSGTTSMPKAAMVTHTYSYTATTALTLTLTRGLRFESDLRLCTFLPVIFHCSHNAGLFPAFFAGGTAIIGRGPEPAAVASAISEERATTLWGGSPAFLDGVAQAATARALDLTSVRLILYAWGALDDATAHRLTSAFGEQMQLIKAFGQTECVSCYRYSAEQWPGADQRVNYVGGPNPLLAARIIDEDGRDLRDSPGVAGEVVYRSPAIMAGYFRDEDATAAALDTGWLRSGDSCLYEPDTGLQIMVDRYKDIVKSGGENVSSLRVEAVVAQHPDVTAAAVIGLPDARWGERVTAVVVLTPGTPLDEPGIIAFARERLAGYEAPKQVIAVTELPTTVGAKVLKYRLRERLAG